MEENPSRFWSKVEVKGPNECWLWLASDNRAGSPQVRWRGTMTLAHHALYELVGLTLPDGSNFTQTCGDRRCMNPSHQTQTRRASERERFYEKVAKAGPGDCWLWQGSTNHNGYGLFRRGRYLTQSAHRIAYEFEHGAPPVGLSVMHSCDRPGCVNPAHLLLGTHADNMRDRNNKRRQAHGERQFSAILRETDIPTIRALLRAGSASAAVAKKYGVHPATIQGIKSGRKWKHVPS